MEGLRGHTTGFAVPTYVVDAPGGGGKIPVMPQYLISQGPDKVVLRNFEGYITTYTEAGDYDPNAIKAWEAKIEQRPEPGQAGIWGLLDGQQLAIAPEGFEATHHRNEIEHHFNQNDGEWLPYHLERTPLS